MRKRCFEVITQSSSMANTTWDKDNVKVINKTDKTKLEAAKESTKITQGESPISRDKLLSQ